MELYGQLETNTYRTHLSELRRLAESRRHSRRTRRAARGALAEIEASRVRLQHMSQEINEWRWKVAGANYQMSGTEAFSMVKQGMRDKGYKLLKLDDSDFKGV